MVRIYIVLRSLSQGIISSASMGPKLAALIRGKRHGNKSLCEDRRNELMHDDRLNCLSVLGVYVAAPKVWDSIKSASSDLKSSTVQA